MRSTLPPLHQVSNRLLDRLSISCSQLTLWKSVCYMQKLTCPLNRQSGQLYVYKYPSNCYCIMCKSQHEPTDDGRSSRRTSRKRFSSAFFSLLRSGALIYICVYFAPFQKALSCSLLKTFHIKLNKCTLQTGKSDQLGKSGNAGYLGE